MADVIARRNDGIKITVDWGVSETEAVAEAVWYNGRNYPGVEFVAVRWVDGQMIELREATTMAWKFLRHTPDGEGYAALVGGDGQIERICGPLEQREMTEANLVAGDFDDDPDDLKWARDENAQGNWSPW